MGWLVGWLVGWGLVGLVGLVGRLVGGGWVGWLRRPHSGLDSWWLVVGCLVWLVGYADLAPHF